MPTITGTGGDDSLQDTIGEDTIDGLGGNDVINSTRGGFDTISGGLGNDRIFVSRGNDSSFGPITIDGGAGDDFIRITDLHDYGATVTGGADNDRIELDTRNATSGVTIDAGSGDDTILFNEQGEAVVSVGLTLGAGADIVRFTTRGATDTKLHVTIADFVTGAGGDRIDFGDYLYLLSGWNPTSNPFAGGFLFLAQQGANTVLYVDRDGSGPGSTLNPLITFTNTTLAALTAYNFFGYAPDGSAPAALALNGTANDDIITGEAGADTIHGLGGNDTIDGKNGSDVVYGDDGNDVLRDYDGAGAELYGGTGNDTLIVWRYSPSYIQSGVIDGGGDDDFIDVTNANASMTILGGSGNDIVRVSGTGAGADRPIIDLGSGNDTYVVAAGSYDVTLGTGADTVRYEALGLANVLDFAVGAGGDSIDVTSALLINALLWDYSTNPFATGHVRLAQSGADIIVSIDRDGNVGSSSQTPIALLKNVTLATLTADNFGGWNPNGTQPAGLVLTGTPGPDTLTGGIGGDTITGLGGDDTLIGYVGNDTIDGGAGYDILDGQWGSDTIDGGADDDIITDTIDGNDTLRGGDGNDLITLTRSQTRFDHGPSAVVLDGGDGNDVIRVIANGTEIGEYIDATITAGIGNDLVTVTAMRSGTIDLGDGSDRLELTSDAQLINAQITLGAGQDVVVYLRPSIDPGTKTITDFQVGDNGDRIEFLLFGPLSFVQQGANTLVLETTGQTTRTVLVLQNVQASQLTGYNIGQGLVGTPGPDQINGTGSADSIYGLASDDQLYGFGGNDSIDGGTGADHMEGGTGDDTYYVDNVGDQVIELPGEGNDRVIASVSYILDGNTSVETLEAAAGVAPINLTGNYLSNTLIGNNGANALHGGGGADILMGLAGNDTYYTDVAATQVVEAIGGGFDQIYTSVSYVLAGGSEVELLSTNNAAGTGAINLTGNNLNQTLVGNDGANQLHGGGGVDVLIGLGGNDIYFTDVAATQPVEAMGGGFDQLYSSVSYVLGSGEIELLSTNNTVGTAGINLTGNYFNQMLLGNDGANFLHGGGGTDVLVGYGGNDIYYTDVAATQVVESAGGGNDQLYTSVSYVLGSGAEVELLSVNDASATAAINLTGSSFGQLLLGNAGANVLDGKGGADTLVGYGGADTFAFTSALGGGNVDVVADFVSGTDKIALDDAVFTALGLGALSANAFVTGSAALDADDRIIYNASNGALYYDADGNGAGAAVQFATLSGAPALIASDFMVI